MRAASSRALRLASRANRRSRCNARFHRGLLALVLAGGAVAAGCQQAPAGAAVRVALRADRVRTDNPAASLFTGTWLGVVCLSQRPPTTLAAAAAAGLVDDFRAALATGDLPVQTLPQSLSLPDAADAPDGDPCDVVLFDDADGDGQWAPGEIYVTAWTGGPGGYRVVHLRAPGAAQPGAAPGWNLVEGGLEPAYRPDMANTVVTVNPLLEPVADR